MDNELNKNEEIHAKGFDMTNFGKIKIGPKSLEDAVLNLGTITKAFPKHSYVDKKYILNTIISNNVEEMRAISNFYYNLNGVYERVCNYFAYLYRYDWYVVPEIYDEEIKEEKILKDFNKVLNYLDNSYIRKISGDIALEVIKNGCYYGYLVPSNEGIII